MTSSSQIITLNVGGKQFQTMNTTLLEEEDTFFTHMLSGKFDLPKNGNEYFIDRDAKFFPIILKYLRTQKLDIDEIDITFSYLRALLEEIDYYQIGSLLKVLDLICKDIDSP
jgi:hypothetical protein